MFRGKYYLSKSNNHSITNANKLYARNTLYKKCENQYLGELNLNILIFKKAF